MDIYCITGKMGSGKSSFCKKEISAHSFRYRNPLVWVEIDEVVRFWHSQKNIENMLYSAWKRNGVICTKYNKKMSKQKILFHSSSAQKSRAWSTLESLFHPWITLYIQKIIEKTQNKKGTLFIDIALPHLFPENIPVTKIYICSSSIYQNIFLLKKYRNFSYKKIFTLLQRQ